MDTDSMYLSLSTDSIDQAVTPELKREYFEKYHEWFPSQACAEHREDFVNTKLAEKPWVKQECCQKVYAYEYRTPGLFKEEFHASGGFGGLISLCSKTYYAYNKDTVKISSKGIQKNKNSHNLTKERFLHVLETQKAGKGVNRGFRTVGARVLTYYQPRNGLSYLYAKRKVLQDGLTTTTLDI